MATAARVPLKLKVKQSYPLFSRPLPAKPIVFNSASTCCALPPKFKVDVKLQSLLSEKRYQYLTTASDSKSGGHASPLLHCSQWAAAAANPNPNKKKSLCENLKKPAMAAVVFLGLLLMHNPKSGLAAPVGRVGGICKAPSESISSKGGPSLDGKDYFLMVLVFLFLGAVMLAINLAYSIIREFLPSFSVAFWVVLAVLFVKLAYHQSLTSVFKLQLKYGLSGSEGRALQMDLNRIAETADTSTNKGLGYVLTDSILALLRHPDCYISGSSSVVPALGRCDAQAYLEKLGFKERLELETLVNVNVDNIKLQSSTNQTSTEEFLDNENMVVILLVAANGVAANGEHEFSATDDLKKALEKLGSMDSTYSLLGVEVLWSPQFSLSATST